MNVGQIRRILRRHLHGRAQIDTNHLLRSEARRKPKVTSFAAPGVQHSASDEDVATEGRDPAEELRFVFVTDFRKARPFIPETLSCGEGRGREGAWEETGNTSGDGVACRTPGAGQLAVPDLAGLARRGFQGEIAAARGTDKPLQESVFHRSHGLVPGRPELEGQEGVKLLPVIPSALLVFGKEALDHLGAKQPTAPKHARRARFAE